MKIFKKIISFTIVSALYVGLFSISSNVSVHGYTSIDDNDLLKSEEDVNISSINPIIKVLGKVLLNWIGKVPLSNNPGSVNAWSDGTIYVMHKSVDFNKPPIYSSVRKDVDVYGQDILRPYMQKNQILVGKISIHIYNHKDDLVADRSLGSGTTFDYKVPGGTNTKYNYYLRYISSNKERWQPALIYLDTKDKCPACIIMGYPNSNLEHDNIIMKDNQVYIKRTNSVSLNDNSHNFNKQLTMNGLFSEFYDDKTRALSDQAKSLSPGDDIIVKDEILDLIYNADEDYTLFKFRSSYPDLDYHTVAFKGDLLENYKPGESLELEFKVEKTEEISGEVFVDLDYNLEVYLTDEFPVIDSYLKNN